MPQKLILESDLPSKGLTFSKAQRNKLIREGKFPAPVKISERKNAWLEHELDAYIEAKIAERGRPAAAYLTASNVTMRPADYDATHLVKATKGLDLNPNSYSTVLIGGQWVRITEANKDRAMDWFAEWAANHVNSWGPDPKIIVPVPSSKSTPATPATFRTAAIAAKIAALCPNTTACPVLRFKAARPNTREEGGSRSPQVLYREMVLTQRLPAGRVMLLDDVMTGGGHLKASAWLVEDQGRKVERALSCGRTLDAQLDDPFAVAPETIDLTR